MKLFSLPTALVTAGLASIALAAAPVGTPVEATTLDVTGASMFHGQQVLFDANNASFGSQMYYGGGNVVQYGGSHMMFFKDPVTNVDTRIWLRAEDCALRVHMTNFSTCGDIQYLRPGTNGFQQ